MTLTEAQKKQKADDKEKKRMKNFNLVFLKKGAKSTTEDVREELSPEKKEGKSRMERIKMPFKMLTKSLAT